MGLRALLPLAVAATATGSSTPLRVLPCSSWSGDTASDGWTSQCRTIVPLPPPTGPFFSNAKTVRSGTTVHRDLAHVARSCEHGT